MNNLLKSIFISFLPVIALSIAIYSAIQLIQNGFSFQYVGAFLASFPNALFFALAFINKKPRTDANLVSYSIVIIIGLAISVIGNGLAGAGFEFTGTSLAIISMSLWLLYLLWYSKFNNRADNPALKVDHLLPEFTLEDSKKNRVSSNSFKGNPSIYLFYRGNWCPLCMAQIKEIAGQYRELEKRGVNMVLVSPQPHRNTASLAKKFKVGFHFLVDRDNKVAKQLNILSKNGLPFGFQVLGYISDTVLPTVIITNKKGKIIFVDLTDNYRVRPEPATFLKVLDEN